MDSQDPFLGRDAARLLTVRTRVAFDETWRKRFECGYLLSDLRAREQQLALAAFAPLFGRCLRVARVQLSPFAMPVPRCEQDVDVHVPAAPRVLPDVHAHRRSLLRRWRALLVQPV